MTDEAKKDLTAVMDQLAECRQRHGMGHVSMFVYEDGWGYAFNGSQYFSGNYILKRYEPAGSKNKEESNG